LGRNFRFPISGSKTNSYRKTKTFTMSGTQNRGPGRPKGTKNKPGAKAGRPRKDTVKTTGIGSESSPHKTLQAQDAGIHFILEVNIVFHSLI
jgi:hypothetical protein